MKKRDHYLSKIWRNFSNTLSEEQVKVDHKTLEKSLNNIISVGAQYHYLIQISDNSLHHVDPNIKNIHNLDYVPKSLQEIINLIHPEDLEYVLLAEQAVFEKISEIGLSYVQHLKPSYCFRMKINNDQYHLFHHQAIHVGIDDEGKLAISLNIHTDIQHITQRNSFIVLIQGIDERDDYLQLDLTGEWNNRLPKLSAREMEILRLLSAGMNSKEIGNKLFISDETVRTHRKRLFSKTNTNKCSQLIRVSFEWGLI